MSQSRVEDRWRDAKTHFPLNSDPLGNPWPTASCCTSAAPLLLHGCCFTAAALLCNWRAEAALVWRKFSNDLRKFQKNKEYKRKEEKREERVCVSLCVCLCVCQSVCMFVCVSVCVWANFVNGANSSDDVGRCDMTGGNGGTKWDFHAAPKGCRKSHKMFASIWSDERLRTAPKEASKREREREEKGRGTKPTRWRWTRWGINKRIRHNNSTMDEHNDEDVAKAAEAAQHDDRGQGEEWRRGEAKGNG